MRYSISKIGQINQFFIIIKFSTVKERGNDLRHGDSGSSITQFIILVRLSPRFTVEAADALLIPLAPPSPPSPTPTLSSSYYRSATSGSLSLGMQENPIVIEENHKDILVCAWCSQVGHIRDDCDTLIRVPSPCETCIWQRKTVCDHYLITPAWTRRQQQAIAQRGWKPRLPWVIRRTSSQ